MHALLFAAKQHARSTMAECAADINMRESRETQSNEWQLKRDQGGADRPARNP
jgi:hypothetical protein